MYLNKLVAEIWVPKNDRISLYFSSHQMIKVCASISMKLGTPIALPLSIFTNFHKIWLEFEEDMNDSQ